MDLRKRLLQNAEEVPLEEMPTEEMPPLPDEELAQSSSVSELEEIPVQVLGNIKARSPDEQLRLDINNRNKLGDEMLTKRQEAEEAGAQELTELEDTQFGNNGIARGLMGAGESLSKTLGAINKADVSGATSGFNSGIAGLNKSEQDAMRRRTFLKERLTRADRPFRTLEDADIMKQRGTTNIQTQAEAPIEFKQKVTQGNLLDKKASGGSEVSEMSRKARALELRQAARTAIKNKDMGTGQQLNAMAQSIEQGNLSNAELSMIEELNVTPEEDKSLEWFKALTQRQAIESKGKDNPLSDAQVETITGFDNIVNTIQDIRNTKPAIDTGKVASARNAIAQKFGMDDAEVSTFKAKVGDQLAQYMKSISGAAISEAEAIRLIANLPTIADNDETFMRKLGNFEYQIKMRRDTFVSNIEKQGKNAQPFMQSSSTSSKSGGRIKLKSANELPDL